MRRRSHRHRRPIRDIISQLSSTPVRPVRTHTPVERAPEDQHTQAREAAVIFKFTVNIKSSPRHVEHDAGRHYLRRCRVNVLEGVDATLFAFVDADADAAGLVWGEAKRMEVWQNAVYYEVVISEANVVNRMARFE